MDIFNRGKGAKKMKKNYFLAVMISIVLFLPINVAAASKMPNDSMIANISIADKTENEISELLESEVTLWQEGADIILESDFEQIMIPRSAFQFDINATINELKERTKRTFSNFFMGQKNVHIPLSVQIDEENEAIQALQKLDYIDLDRTLTSVEEMASQLDSSPVNLTYIEGEEIPLETIASVEMQIPTLSNAMLTYAIDELNGFIISSEETFSFLQTVTFPEGITNSTKEASFLATALYSLFLQTNFDIIERHAGLTVPPYAESGLDVVVNDKETKDFIVMNPNNISYKIEISKKNDHINAELKGFPSETTYQYETKKVKEIKQRTIYRYSKKLKAGEQETIQKGQNGVMIEVHRSSYSDNNTFIDSERISQDVYLPVPKVVLVSTDEAVTEEEQVDPESIEDKIDELEQDMNDLDEELVDDGESTTSDASINIVPIDQLEEILQRQEELQEKIIEMEEKIKVFELTMEEDMDGRQEKLDKRFKDLKEKYEQLFEHLLDNDIAVEEGKETAK